MGYVSNIFPLLVKSTFVVFDRYYHDLLVDTKRYRYGGSRWFAKFIAKFIPQPDLWILLDAPAEVLQARKQEVSFEETARQIEAYLQLIQNLPNGYIVDASMPLDSVVTNLEKIILSHLEKKVNKRLKL